MGNKSAFAADRSDELTALEVLAVRRVLRLGIDRLRRIADDADDGANCGAVDLAVLASSALAKLPPAALVRISRHPRALAEPPLDCARRSCTASPGHTPSRP